MSYVTREGDVVDMIALSELGDEAYAIDILEANRWLSDHPPRLPAGLVIEIPAVVVAQPAATIRLWGSA